MVLSAKYGRTQWNGGCGWLAGRGRSCKCVGDGTGVRQTCPPGRGKCIHAGGLTVGNGEKITNVLKDTVSVLYWYEELSSLRLAIFGMVLRNFFFCVWLLAPSPPPCCPGPTIPHHSPPFTHSLPHICMGAERGGRSRRYPSPVLPATQEEKKKYTKRKKDGSTALRVPKSSLTSVLTKPVAA